LLANDTPPPYSRLQIVGDARSRLRRRVLKLLNQRELKYLARICLQKVITDGVLSAAHPEVIMSWRLRESSAGSEAGVRPVPSSPNSDVLLCGQMADPASGEFYYYNHNNGESTWMRPHFLTKPDEDITLAWQLHWRVNTETGAYEPAYYNAEKLEWSVAKPDGYLLCQMCRSDLAFRHCDGPGCDGMGTATEASELESEPTRL
jgi:hypothetical protein